MSVNCSDNGLSPKLTFLFRGLSICCAEYLSTVLYRYDQTGVFPSVIVYRTHEAINIKPLVAMISVG